jgi:hypothetical protein
MGRHQINDQKGRYKKMVGKCYQSGGKIWKVSTVLLRHDGVFLFLRRDEGNRIIMREVLLDTRCIIDGGADEEGSDPKTREKGLGNEEKVCTYPTAGGLGERESGPATTKGEAGRRDVGTGAWEDQA